RVRHERGGVAADPDRAVALPAQRAHRLGTGIIELAAPADAGRARGEHQDRFYVVASPRCRLPLPLLPAPRAGRGLRDPPGATPDNAAAITALVTAAAVLIPGSPIRGRTVPEVWRLRPPAARTDAVFVAPARDTSKYRRSWRPARVSWDAARSRGSAPPRKQSARGAPNQRLAASGAGPESGRSRARDPCNARVAPGQHRAAPPGVD